MSATAVHWSVEITDLSNDIDYLEFVTCDWTFYQICVTDVITVTKKLRKKLVCCQEIKWRSFWTQDLPEQKLLHQINRAFPKLSNII